MNWTKSLIYLLLLWEKKKVFRIHSLIGIHMPRLKLEYFSNILTFSSIGGFVGYVVSLG